jgi:hypothetical protein
MLRVRHSFLDFKFSFAYLFSKAEKSICIDIIRLFNGLKVILRIFLLSKRYLQVM